LVVQTFVVLMPVSAWVARVDDGAGWNWFHNLERGRWVH